MDSVHSATVLEPVEYVGPGGGRGAPPAEHPWRGDHPGVPIEPEHAAEAKAKKAKKYKALAVDPGPARTCSVCNGEFSEDRLRDWYDTLRCSRCARLELKEYL